MSVVSIANQKGGVGKTSTAYHLARAAHTQGKRVLLIDADPQGNLTTALAAEALPETVPGVADVLSARSEETLATVLVPTLWDGVDLAPTVGDVLAAVRDEMIVAGAGREARLAKALGEVRENYDLVLIDCAPSLDLLTINALTASEKVLIVTHPAQWSANGLARLLETIGNVSEYYNPALTVVGVVINQYEKIATNDQHWRLEIEQGLEARGLKILQSIPKRSFVKASSEAGSGLDEWPGSESSDTHQAYVRLAQRLTETTSR